MPRPESSSEEADSGLPAPGQRWGAGAQSVLPYLTKSLQARPAAAPEGRDLQGREAEARQEQRSR
jgi:hypothetical protein